MNFQKDEILDVSLGGLSGLSSSDIGDPLNDNDSTDVSSIDFNVTIFSIVYYPLVTLNSKTRLYYL